MKLTFFIITILSILTLQSVSQEATIVCEELHFLHDGECLFDCPAGTFGNFDTWTCESCDQSCETCQNADQCLTCPQGSFLDFRRNFICQACQEGCLDCDRLLSCNSCAPGYHQSFFRSLLRCVEECPPFQFLNTQTNTCESECSSGFYADEELRTCQPCNESCLTCSDAESCLTCPQGSYINPRNNLLCDACEEGCLECDRARSCTSCAPGFIQSFFRLTLRCLESCAPFQFINSATNTCELECPTGTYGNEESRTCEPCNAICETCDNSQTCLTCPQGSFLDFRRNFVCQACQEGCLDCDRLLSCNSCAPGYHQLFFRSLLRCIEECRTFEYLNTETNTCQQCGENCRACQGIDQCTECQEGFVLEQGICNTA